MSRHGVAAALALIGALACGGEEAGGRSEGPDGLGGERVIPVETGVVERATLEREAVVAGAIEPIRSVGVNGQIAGIVRSVSAEEGDRVGPGQVLARLDTSEIQAALASAEANHEVAQAAWERAQRLQAEQIITLPEYERDRAAFAAAEAQRSQLRTRLGYGTIRSPLAGVVTEKAVEAGDLVAVQQPLFRIADVSTLVVRVGVSELDVVHLSEGETVGLVLDAYPDRSLSGRIRRIFPAADPATRLVPVEVAVEPGSPARPGFLARVRFALDVRRDVPVLPADAVVEREGGSVAFVVVNGRAERREVRTGLVQEGRVEIVDGLSAGEVVVVQGASSLRDGARVRPLGDGVAPTAPTSAEAGGP